MRMAAISARSSSRGGFACFGIYGEYIGNYDLCVHLIYNQEFVCIVVINATFTGVHSQLWLCGRAVYVINGISFGSLNVRIARKMSRWAMQNGLVHMQPRRRRLDVLCRPCGSCGNRRFKISFARSTA